MSIKTDVERIEVIIGRYRPLNNLGIVEECAKAICKEFQHKDEVPRMELENVSELLYQFEMPMHNKEHGWGSLTETLKEQFLSKGRAICYHFQAPVRGMSVGEIYKILIKDLKEYDYDTMSGKEYKEARKDYFLNRKEVSTAIHAKLQPVKVSGGHKESCYYCSKPTNCLSANPNEWAIPLCHKEEPGVVKWHHIGCVSERLAKLQAPKVIKWPEEIKQYHEDCKCSLCSKAGIANEMLALCKKAERERWGIEGEG